MRIAEAQDWIIISSSSALQERSMTLRRHFDLNHPISVFDNLEEAQIRLLEGN